TPVSVRPGRATYSRIFRVPRDIPAGTYDVAWGLLSEDMRSSYGLEVQPGILSVTGTTAPEQVPPSIPDPEETVRRFYALLGSQDFDAAWDLLSDRFRASVDYSTWVSGYATTRSVRT